MIRLFKGMTACPLRKGPPHVKQWQRLKVGLVAIEGRIGHAIMEHQTIGNAILERDTEKAGATMVEHLCATLPGRIAMLLVRGYNAMMPPASMCDPRGRINRVAGPMAISCDTFGINYPRIAITYLQHQCATLLGRINRVAGPMAIRL